MSSNGDIKIDALKNNEDYHKALEQAKEKIKSKVLSMSTKEEQIRFVQEEKNRYKLLKETDNTHLTIALIIAVCALISIILLSLLKSNIILLILWLIAIVILIVAVTFVMIMSNNSKRINYTIERIETILS